MADEGTMLVGRQARRSMQTFDHHLLRVKRALRAAIATGNDFLAIAKRRHRCATFCFLITQHWSGE